MAEMLLVMIFGSLAETFMIQWGPMILFGFVLLLVAWWLLRGIKP